ncbi:C40 family peptidase [Actinomadura barringtoniae]|uniref:C40 family peptidase n=1 Tax=Actinomadura barringtoniae TaxID=1427535 RepID=A0A939T214_9ACTN|nr:NlpC/P60 family protein [Actinomadura barringtoniae]MBO2448716.1 C40 family peptidase [Actinomadura barringtoniae]
MSGSTTQPQRQSLAWWGLAFGIAPVMIAPIGLGVIAVLLTGTGGSNTTTCIPSAGAETVSSVGRTAGWRHDLASTFWDTGHSGYGDTGAPASGMAMQKFSVAHRTLPLRSWITVTAGNQGRTATLQVIDRGPAAWTGREFDLDTYSAAWFFGRENQWNPSDPGRDASPGVFHISWKPGRRRSATAARGRAPSFDHPNCQPRTTRPPASNTASGRVLTYARAQLGKPYVWGAVGPDSFDCSGLTSRAYRAAGITIPRIAADQSHASSKIPRGHEQPGDLAFFAGSDGTFSNPGHVGIVIDPAHHRMIEAACTACGPIRISSYRRGDLVGFGRFKK